MSARILVGPAIRRLRELPDDSVHCCITSPPYWGLRTYDRQPGMIGLEPTFAEHLANLIDVFREVRRVLRPDGTLWVNYGDRFASSSTPEFKSKDVMLMPHRLAIALQDDGWWVRSGICWDKPTSLPESPSDRPVRGYEMVYLFSKSQHYFYDYVATLQPSRSKTENSPRQGGETGAVLLDDGSVEPMFPALETPDVTSAERSRVTGLSSGVRLRDVWHIAPEHYQGAHFAVMPKKLVELCILSSTSAQGVCSVCGAPQQRQIRKEANGRQRLRVGSGLGALHSRESHGRAEIEGDFREKVEVSTVCWTPTCDHETEVEPAVVLDPFAGAGTVGVVADRLGRSSVLVEVNPAYAEMIRTRLIDDSPLYARLEIVE